MAELKSLLVNGDARITGTLYANISGGVNTGPPAFPAWHRWLPGNTSGCFFRRHPPD